MAEYTKPPIDSIPFKLGGSGYTVDYSSLNFNFTIASVGGVFKSIQATLTPKQLHYDEAYTYLKERPKYVVGYEAPGKVKFVYGRAIYGGVRDFRVYAKGVYSSIGSISAQLDVEGSSFVSGAHRQLPSYLKACFPSTVDLGGSLTPSGGFRNLLTNIKVSTYNQTDLTSSLDILSYHYDEAYTYVKKCRDYVIGYGPSGIQVISAPCVYGGLRDLRVFTKGIYTSTINLYSEIIGIYINIKELPTYIGGVLPVNLSGSIKALHKVYSGISASLTPATVVYYRDLLASISVSTSAYLYGSIRPWYSKYSDIGSYLNSILFKDVHDLKSNIASDQPLDISSTVRPWYKKYRDLNTYLFSELFKDDKYLSGNIGTEKPIDLPSILQSWHVNQYSNIVFSALGVLHRDTTSINANILAQLDINIRSSITPVHSVERDLVSSLSSVLFRGYADLYTGVKGHLPVYLPASIESVHKVYEDLTASLVSDISTLTLDIGSSIGGHQPVDLSSLVKPMYKEQRDITAYLQGKLLTGSNSFTSFIDIHPPSDIPTDIRGWGKEYLNLYTDLVGELKKGKSFLSSIIGGEYPTNLLSNIKPVISTYKYILGSITSMQREIIGELPANLSISKPRDLLSNIVAEHKHVPANLIFEAIPTWFKGTRDLGFDLKPSKPVDVKGSITAWQRKVMSNLLSEVLASFFSSYTTLKTSITVEPPRNIRVAIRPWYLDIPRNLNSTAIPVWFKGDKALDIYMGGVWPVDVRSSITPYYSKIVRDLNSTAIPIWFKGDKTLNAFAIPSFPRNITANARPVHERIIKDLPNVVYAHEPIYLYSSIGGHTPEYIKSSIYTHAPRYIQSSIKPTYKKYLNLYFDATPELFKSSGDVSAFIDRHYPVHLSANATPLYKGYLDILFSATAVWFSSDRGLGTSIKTHQPQNIRSDVGVHLPVYLESSISVHLPRYIEAYITVHKPVPLTSDIATEQPVDLLGAVKPFHRDYIFLASYILGEERVGILNMPAFMAGRLPANISGKVNVHLPVELRSYIFTLPPINLPSNINAVPPRNLKVFMSGHLPEDLNSYIFGSEIRDLYFNVYSFSAKPHDIGSYIRVFQYKELPTDLHGWQALNINAFIDKHLPGDIPAYINMFDHKDRQLPVYVHGWDTIDLKLVVENTMFAFNLNVALSSHLAGNLSSYLKVWPQGDIKGTLHGWDYKDLNVDAYLLYKSDIVVYMKGIRPGVLNAFISGSAVAIERNLPATAFVFRYIPLSASIFTYLNKDLRSYLFAIKSVNIKSTIHGYDLRFIGGSIIGKDYPYNLTAYIVGSGSFGNLNFSIMPVQGLQISRDLISYLYACEMFDLNSSIKPIAGVNLKAYLVPHMSSLGLHANIIPKMVRMTKVVDVLTMEKLDLTAMINVSCGRSTYSDITSYINTVFLSSISAVLYGKAAVKEYANLMCSIGYDNTIITSNKIPVYISTYDSSYKTENKLNLSIRIWGGTTNLTSFIKGLPLERNLLASIKGQYIDDYVFTQSKRKVRVYSINHVTRSRRLSKIVELTFRDFVKEYIYLSDSEQVVKEDQTDQWVARLNAYLPRNITLRLKRRFFKAIDLFGTYDYNNIDQLVREGIAYVIEEPKTNLNASLNLEIHSMSSNLKALLSIRKANNTFGDLGCTISSITPAIWSKTDSEIQKFN